MAILVDRETRVLIQGITGRSGVQVTSELLDYGTKVVAWVTPGKGGQEIDTVPVFNSVSEAIKTVGEVDVAMVYVPPLSAHAAAMEAIEAKIALVHIFVEKMPVFDVCQVLSLAVKNQVRVLGPASVGAISPGEGKIGSIGGPAPGNGFCKGPICVFCRSGGMGIGGDLIVGTTFSDLLIEFEQDRDTKAVVAFGEVGGSSEIEVARLIEEGKFTKPFIIFLAGKFAEKLRH